MLSALNGFSGNTVTKLSMVLTLNIDVKVIKRQRIKYKVEELLVAKVSWLKIITQIKSLMSYTNFIPIICHF